MYKECAGCGGSTNRIVIDTDLMLCNSCTLLIQRTCGFNPLETRQYFAPPTTLCLGCGFGTSKDSMLCPLCLPDILNALTNLGVTLNDNSWVYELVKPSIDFGEKLNLSGENRGSGPTWFRYWQRFEGWVIIDFSKLLGGEAFTPPGYEVANPDSLDNLQIALDI